MARALSGVRVMLVALWAITFSAGVMAGPVTRGGADPAVLERLTPAQRAYVARNPIMDVAVVGGWPPFEILEGERPTGLSPELLVDVGSRLGMQARFRRFENFQDVMRAACEGTIDVVMNASLSAERTRCLVYTESYAEAPIGLIAHPNDPQLRDDPDLAGVRLVSNVGTATERLARERFPHAIHLTATSPFEAMTLVRDGLADAYLGDAQVAARLLLEQGFDDLALVRPSDLPYDLLHYAVPNPKQPLAEALNVALDSVTNSERQAYDDRWLVKLSWVDRGDFAIAAGEAQVLRQPLRVGWPIGFAPIAFADSNGRPAGLASEYLRKLRLVGAQFHVVQPMHWDALQEAMKNGKVDVVFGVPRDSAWLGDDWLFSKPFASVANVVVAAKQRKDIHSLSDLNGLRVVVSDPERISRYIKAAAPQAVIVSAPTSASALKKLSLHEVDAYVGNLAVADALIRTGYAGSLDVVAAAGFQDELSVAVQRRYSPLISVLDRVLTQMDPGEKEALRSKWLAVSYSRGLNWTEVWRWLAPLLGIMITAIVVQAWNQMRLSREVQRRKETELKLEEARLVAERAARAKSDFLATMSHEIRTPMSAVMGMVEVLGRSDLTRSQQEVLAVVSDSAVSLRLLLDDILDVSRLEGDGLQLNPSAVQVRRLVAGVGALMEPEADRKNIRWLVQVSPMLAEAHLLDELRLRQVLINLVGNAIKFTTSGSVGLSVQVVRQELNAQTLRFTVTDTGAGMSSEEQARVIQPFAQASAATAKEYGGTGLGLAIVSGLLKLMGSALQISSSPGRGTEVSFNIDVPIIDSVQEVEEEHLALQPLPGQWRVLVAEDDPANLILMRHRLESLGVDAVLVNDGAQALDALRSNGDFDALITDCQMPNMDGYALSRAVRAEEVGGDTRLPIVAMTASASGETENACRASGVDRVLLKPFDLAALRATLEALLPVGETQFDGSSISAGAEEASAPAGGQLSESEDVATAWQGLIRQVGSPGVARQVVDALAGTFRDDVPALRRALDSDDGQSAGRLVHRLAGGLGMVGLKSLSAVGQRLEPRCSVLAVETRTSIEDFLRVAEVAVGQLSQRAGESDI